MAGTSSFLHVGLVGFLGLVGGLLFGAASVALAVFAGPSTGNVLDGTASWPWIWWLAPAGAALGAGLGVRLADALCGRTACAGWIYAVDGAACAAAIAGAIFLTSRTASTPFAAIAMSIAAAGSAASALTHAVLS